ncbi:MAG: M48 family metalloprotease [Verrucomicrobiota bacterium]
MNGHPPTAPDYAILSAIHPIARRPKTSVLYQINLFVVAIVMVLLPVIYFVLVGLASYGVYYHAVHHAHWLTTYGSRAGRAIILLFLAYIIPLVVGAVIVFFMIKPIFAGRPKRAQPLALNPADNPLLYAFIEKICQTVGAPSPKRIDLDCDLNASAGFRRGFGSMFGNDLVLTIGLPLVANLSISEFGGVVAHEFGHFTQSVGMRLSYIIRSVNFWFMRVIYERDAWDETLEQWAAEVQDGYAAAIVWTTQIGVFFARLILRVLMYIGWLIGGFMMRQMEYDADAWEIKLAGSETFERTQRKLATLSAAMDKMYKQIRVEWQKNRHLPDNLSELLRQNHESLSAETLQKIEDASGLERTGLFDSHPSLADRIRQARRVADSGVFHDTRPASELFSSFDHPARFVTLLHYTDDLDIPVTQDMLLRVEAKVPVNHGRPGAGAVLVSRASVVKLDEYFLGALPLLLPVRLPPLVPSMNYEADMTELLEITGRLQDVQGQLEPIVAQYDETSEQLIQARTAAHLLSAGLSVVPEDYGLSNSTLEAAQAAEADALQSRESLSHSLREVGNALQRRLQLGLSLRLAAPEEAGECQFSNQIIAETLVKLEPAAERFVAEQQVVDALAVFDRLTALRQPSEDSPELERAIAAQLDVINSLHPGVVEHSACARSTMQLKRSGPIKHADDDAELPRLRQETEHWLSEYHAELELLVTVAQSAEGIQA